METIRIERITDPLTTGNCYILLENGHAVIIDPNDEDRIEEVLRQYEAEPDYVLLTHEHADHISGLNGLREHYRFQTVASLPCSRRIQDIRSNLSRIFGVYLIFITGERVRNYPKFVCEAADVTFEERLLFVWQEHKFEMVLTPGHSPGSAAIRLDEKWLFSGDSLLGDREVVVRFDGGSEEDFLTKAVPYYRSLPENTRVYPGHGEPFLLKDGIFQPARPQVEP